LPTTQEPLLLITYYTSGGRPTQRKVVDEVDEVDGDAHSAVGEA